MQRENDVIKQETTFVIPRAPLSGICSCRCETADPQQEHLGERKRLGFTLIELLVVVLIIGILAAVALPQYQKAVTKSRAAAVMPLLRAIANAEETYYLANNQYTASYDELSVSLPAGTTVSGGTATLPNGLKIILMSSGYVATTINEGKETGVLQLHYWFRHGIGKNHNPFECYAAVADSLGISICKSFSNKEPYSGNCGARGSAEACKGYAMY